MAQRTAPSQSLLGLLRANDGELFIQIISYTPLLVGAWVAGGIELPQPIGFATLLLIVIFHHYFELILRGRTPEFFNRRWMPLGAAAAAIGFCVWRFNPFAALLLAAYGVLGFLTPLLPLDSRRRILMVALTYPVRMAALAVLAVYSQSQTVLGAAALLGSTAGFYLTASIVARHGELLEASGWIRAVPSTDRKGNSVVRPGRLSQWFAILLVIGPTICTGLAVLRCLPPTFLLAGIPMYFMPRLASAFMEQFLEDGVIADQCLRVALVAEISVFVSAILVSYW